MNKIAVVLAAGAVLLLTAPEARAQQRWGFELRGGADAPTQEVGGEGLGTGVGFEGSVGYRFLPHLGAYAGWGSTRFAPDASFAGADADFEETGYAFGLRFEHPFSGEEPAGPGWAWWLRAGGTYDHIEIEDADGDLLADSGHGPGWEAGAGVAYGFAGGWSLTPGVRYRSLTRDVEVGAVATEVRLRYVALELGLARSF